MKDKIEKLKELVKSGKISLFDIDRDEDLMWAISDLYNIEKHLSDILIFLSKKLDEEPNNEYYKKLFEFTKGLLNEIRIHRSKHLKRLQKFEEYGFWCLGKHLLGAMSQFTEVGAKDIYKGEDDEIIKLDFDTANLCRSVFLFINRELQNIKKLRGENSEVKRTA